MSEFLKPCPDCYYHPCKHEEARIRADERDACAKIAEDVAVKTNGLWSSGHREACGAIAAAIRARGGGK